MEVELSKETVNRFRQRMLKGEKIAAKLDFKLKRMKGEEDEVELHLVDDREFVFKLQGYRTK
jgi:hypothetical protein